MLMPFSNFLEKLNSTSKHYFVSSQKVRLLSSHPGTRTGTQSKFRFSFFLLFVSFSFFSILLPADTQRVLWWVSIFKCATCSLYIDRDWLFGSQTHGPISKQHGLLLPKGSWFVYSLTHPHGRTLGTRLSRSHSLRKHQHLLTISDSSLGRVYVLQISRS